MRADLLLFTQTMYSLLSSFMPLQGALAVCGEILTGKADRDFAADVLKKLNEGKKLASIFNEKKTLPPLYVQLVSVGEESGTLAEVFGHLASYLRDKKNMRRRMIQALLYPLLVLVTAVAVVFILTLFVLPNLEGIFDAFASSSEEVTAQMNRISGNFHASVFVMTALLAVPAACVAVRKVNERAALALDTVMLRLPFIRDFMMTMQMHDFSFAMKLFSQSHFPLVQSLSHAGNVLGNARLRKAVESVCHDIACGKSAGRAFEDEKVFPKYLTVWIKIAEENGNVAEAFCQICDYYRSESEGLLSGITQAAEPVFILVTGAIIITVLSQFVIPVFNLLGAL